jgi:hypothetical protein
MSFILDALRKSESERQREASARLSRAPLATVRHRVPAWAWLLIALLSVGLIALATAWWQSMPAPPTIAPTTTVESGPVTPPERPAAASLPATEPEVLPTTPPGLAPISELRVIEPGLPEYRLELIANNNQDPAQGSAWINGRRYYIGERIGSAGPELVEVRPDSVVLAYGGSRFLLTTR